MVGSIFTLLEHTPFDKMGLNRFLHCKVESEERWHRFGDMLVPKVSWKATLSKPGLRSVTMEGTRADAPDARIQVKVEPSTRVHPGIFFTTNEHYELSGADVGRRLIATMAGPGATAPRQDVAVGRRRFIIPSGSPQEHEPFVPGQRNGATTESLSPVGPSRVVRIPRGPEARQRFILLQQWEGTVTT